jgi:hypothetical protein
LFVIVAPVTIGEELFAMRFDVDGTSRFIYPALGSAFSKYMCHRIPDRGIHEKKDILNYD